MFDVSLSEMLVVFLVGCLIIDPKSLPSMVKKTRMYYKKVIAVKHEIIDLVKNIDLDELEYRDDVKVDDHIIGEDGKAYKVYDIKDLVKDKKDQENDR